MEHTESHGSLSLVRGVAIGKQISKSFNSMFIKDSKSGKLISRQAVEQEKL